MTTTKKTANKQAANELRETAQRIWHAGLGALAVAEEEGSKLFKSLVAKGEEYESKGKVQVDKLRGELEAELGKARSKAGKSWEKLEETVDETVTSTLHRMGVPSRDEIKNLTRRVEELNASVEKLKPKTKATASAGTSKAAGKTA